MKFELSQSFYFEAAHTLQRHIEADGSRRIHGHTYQAEATVSGEPDPVTGMVVDLGRLRAAIDEVRSMLDHHFLDDVPGLGPATLENLCRFILAALAQRVGGVLAVRVSRTASGDSCTLRVG
jgi:6-pyruvoyltetrahydropterin/6-carboxytetrahydropterin synthase